MAFPRLGRGTPLPPPKRPRVLGTTFSQLQCAYMGLDYRAALTKICTLGLNRIRLCAYWNEIEPIENQFDFSTLDWLLDECHQHGVEVVLALGMKAPRWPEFHFPDWVKSQYDTNAGTVPIDQRNPGLGDRTLRFVQRVMEHTREAPGLQYWQIENEPFARLEITGGRFLSSELVRQEVELARSIALPNQKVVLTNAISLPDAGVPEDEQAFAESLMLADAVGINVYTKVPAGNSFFYLQPRPPYWEKLKAWQNHLTDNGREDWIAEAQAEPWEPNQLVAMQKTSYPSSSPHQTTTLVTSLTELGYSTVMLWGCEYWYWHRMQGRNFWWWTIQRLANA